MHRLLIAAFATLALSACQADHTQPPPTQLADQRPTSPDDGAAVRGCLMECWDGGGWYCCVPIR